MERIEYTIIAESGSTKVNWVLLANWEKFDAYQSPGMNPFTKPRNELVTIARQVRQKFIDYRIGRIHFYGAGCSDQEHINTINEVISKHFDAELIIRHDLEASVKATLNDKDGIAGILGTGSNIAIQKNGIIEQQIPSLGYIIGDDGSASNIGKNYLRKLYYRQIPERVLDELPSYLKPTSSACLHNLYHEPNPNIYLADLAGKISAYKQFEVINECFYLAFQSFVENLLENYRESGIKEVSFVGSVAFHNQVLLESILEKYKWKAGLCIKDPMEHLIEYLKNKYE